MTIRDVNSRKSYSRVESRNSPVLIEILDFTRVQSIVYRRDQSWIAGGGARGGGIAGRTPMSFTADAGTPSVPLAHLKRHKTARGGSYKGSTTGEAQWLISPRTMGWGITVPLLPLPCQTPLDNQSTSWEDGRMKRRAAAGSLALWRTCHNANMERDGGTRSPTGPQTPSSGDPRPAVGRGRTIGRHLSDLSCFLQRQTEAAAFALPGRSSGVTSYQHPVAETSASATPYHLDTPLSFVSRRPCVWYAGHGRSEAKQAITDTSVERQVTIIRLTIDLLSGGH